MIITHAELQVNPAKEEEFLAEIRTLIAASKQEEGNVDYSLKRDVENPNHFTMIEIWKDMDAVQSHNNSEHFKAFGAKAKAFLAGPLAVRMFEGQELKLS
ncbi:antibiotic biosynthesis monooxygenase [Bacillus sp. JRC01]|nr:antibiotic biosynthesis monooxygenase [Bacillus sp. JRC01]